MAALDIRPWLADRAVLILGSADRNVPSIEALILHEAYDSHLRVAAA